MIKVLELMPRFTTGGAEMLVWYYYSRLDSHNFNVHAGSVVEDGELSERFADKNRVFVGSVKKLGSRFTVWQELKKYVTNFKPDIIHSHLLAADFFAYLLKCLGLFNGVWICTQHNVETNTVWWRKILWKIILKKANAVIAVSNGVAQYAGERFGVPPNKLHLIFNGIDSALWGAIPNDDILQNKELRLAIIGRLEKQKGHVYLLDALAQLKDMPWRLDIFGNGTEREILENKTKRLGINNRITWHGAVKNLSEHLKNIDAVIQPSLWEGLSLVVLEAMAGGRVVVASQAAASEIIKHGVTGYVLPKLDVSSIVTALRWLFDRRDEAQGCARAGRAFVQDNFSIDSNIRAVAELYKKMLKG